MDEDVWKEAFQNEIFIRDIQHFWTLEIEESFQKQQKWLQYTLCSFARFCCELCGRRWASSKVHILFQIKLERNAGRVKMHIFKQKCRICNTDYYEQPLFIPENIEIAISLLFNRICEKLYNIPKENMPSTSFIKEGSQDGPHDCKNCEGCAHGICNIYINRNEGSTQSNTWSNTQSNSQSNTQSKSQSNTQSNTQSKSQSNSKSNTQSKSQSNTQSNTQSNSQSNTQSKSQSNSKSKSQSNTQSNTQSNSQSNSQSNTWSNTQSNTQSNVHNDEEIQHLYHIISWERGVSQTAQRSLLPDNSYTQQYNEESLDSDSSLNCCSSCVIL
ncbi:uncharacterized protein [Phyllobates terribilis]|uniref:uncharacterized protein n=1 Tax=Phyllobates terribilis TaxID=111132 RepID=UPI003CCB2FC2